MIIALTGGPGAGKTAISARLEAEHPTKFVRVPEAATLVYTALRTRWDRLDVAGRRDVQRRIYALQLEQQEHLARDHPGKILLADRGTVDGAAYWPDGPEDYWPAMGSTWETELGRYAAVIWLQSCAAIGLYDGRGNPCRHEDAQAAVRMDERMAQVWSAHPHLIRVEAMRSLDAKVEAVMEALKSVMRNP